MDSTKNINIDGIEKNRYTVSSNGVVYDTTKGRVLKKSQHASGKLTVSLRKDTGKGYITYYLSLLVADIFLPHLPKTVDGKRTVVVHKNGDIHDCRAENLARVVFDKDRSKKTKNIIDLVSAIREASNRGMSMTDIAASLGLSGKPFVELVLNGDVYGDV